MSAKTVIPRLDAIFAGHGILLTMKSENGPPFNIQEFKDFAIHVRFQPPSDSLA